MLTCCKVVFILSQGLLSFSFPASQQAGGTQEVVRGHNRDSWPQLTEELSHTTEYHAQHIKLGEIGQEEPIPAQGLSGHHSVGGELLLCAWLGVYFFFYFSLLCCLPFHYNYYYCYKYYILFQFLNCFYLNPWVLPSSQLSSPSNWRKRWATGCMVLNCQLGLNHDKEQTGCNTRIESNFFLSVPAFHHL